MAAKILLAVALSIIAVNAIPTEVEKMQVMARAQMNFAEDLDNRTTIETQDPYQFRYVPVTRKGCFNVWVKAGNEAHLSLSNAAQYLNPKIKIVIGGWNNKASAIVLNDNVNAPPIKTNTPEILNKNEYVGFWIRYSQKGDILVGKHNERFPFLVYAHSEQWYPINFLGVTCGPQIKGSWIINENPYCPM